MALINIDLENKSTELNENELVERVEENKFSDNNTYIDIPMFFAMPRTITNTVSCNLNEGVTDPCVNACQCSAQVVQSGDSYDDCTVNNQSQGCTNQNESVEFPSISDNFSVHHCCFYGDYVYLLKMTCIIKCNKNMEILKQFGDTTVSKQDNTGFNLATSCCVDKNGNIFVSDKSNKRIVKLDSDLNYITQFGVTGETKSDNTGMDSPEACMVDPLNNIYVLDNGINNRFIKLSNTLSFISSFGKDHSIIDTPDVTTMVDGYGCAIDSIGNIYMLNTKWHVLVKFDKNFNYKKHFGTITVPKTDDTGFKEPTDCIIDSNDNIYVSDSGNNRVVKLNSNMEYVRKFDFIDASVFGSRNRLGRDLEDYIYLCRDSNEFTKINPSSMSKVEFCGIACQAACQSGCQTTCESVCQTTCEKACQATCELGCQTACEKGCQCEAEGCQSCQTTCELACQCLAQGCQTCQTTCEKACQDACQTGCEAACEKACQCEVQGCQTCQTNCQLNCQTECQSACQCTELGCQTCQATCQATCQCSVQGCESCQTFCETGCQCAEQGCQTCQSNCQSSCQCLDQSDQCSICESACQEVCESACQCSVQGCQTCQDVCQLNCQTSCQTACQCENQTTQVELPSSYAWNKQISNERTIITSDDLNDLMDAYAKLFAFSGVPMLEMTKVPDVPNSIWDIKYYNSLILNINRLYNYGVVGDNFMMKKEGEIINLSDIEKLVTSYNSAISNLRKSK